MANKKKYPKVDEEEFDEEEMEEKTTKKSKSKDDKEDDKKDMEVENVYSRSISKEKLKLLQKEYIYQNVEKSEQTSVNWATTDELEALLSKHPNDSVFRNEINERYQNNEEILTINLKKDEIVKFYFYSKTNNYDKDNAQRGFGDKSYKRAMAKKLYTNNPKVKVVAVFGGNFLGSNWTFNKLLESVFNKKYNVYSYFGLIYRKKKLKEDIKFALSHGAKELILMNGPQEYQVMKKSPTHRDILQEITDELKDSRIHYVKNVRAEFNLVRKVYKDEIVANFEIFTNTNSKAHTANGAVAGAFKSNGPAGSDATFVMNSNVAGQFGENIFFLSGQAIYQDTVKKDLPLVAPKNFDVLYADVVGTHQLEIVAGNGYYDIDNYSNNKMQANHVQNINAIDKKRANLDLKRDILYKLIDEKLKKLNVQKHDEIMERDEDLIAK